MVIRGGLVVDGTGSPPAVMDVAIKGDRIVSVAHNIDHDTHEIVDARGKIVTPGFIDMHTHYDGQVTWDSQILPASGHGVTTVVTGCCGVGFAPVRPGTEDWLINLMDGVEDIPGVALAVGIPWGWETFPEYLEAIAQREYALDVACQVPHSAVRAYVLGRRAEKDERATDEELDEMAHIVQEGIEAGAIGFSTSRVNVHRGADGGNVPGTAASEEELLALVSAMRDGGGGVFQLIPSGFTGGVAGEEGEPANAGMGDHRDVQSLSVDIQALRRIHQKTGQPVTLSFAENEGLGRAEFKRALAVIDEIEASGEKIFPQFAPRATSVLIYLDSYHIFTGRPSYQALAHLPVAERAREMARSEVKAAILSENDIDPNSGNPMDHMNVTLQGQITSIYSVNSGDFEPPPDQSIEALAKASGHDPFDLFYDLLIADEGKAVLAWFANSYVDGNLDRIADYLDRPQFVMGLGDGGAHVQFISDASFPTFLLTHWGRDRTRGPTFPLELLVRKLTMDPADLYSLHDRGVIAEGRRADINVIDYDRLALCRPHIVADLPTGARRILQDTTGYLMTIVGGVVVRRDDVDTGARPGRLVRSYSCRARTEATVQS
ncbi:MAG: amidohydrolase family protein [Proteobacteria bacterium]|nr:amidohydrolase family protein [Pseudomonadota bacterium]